MTNNIDLEIKVIKRFIVKTKQDRYLAFINSDKNRHKFTGDLAHFRDIKQELFDEVKGDERKFIKERIKVLGNLNDCYLISESSELDQKRLDIDTALSEVIGYNMGTIIVFGDAEIIYYEAEGSNQRWISKLIKFE